LNSPVVFEIEIGYCVEEKAIYNNILEKDL